MNSASPANSSISTTAIVGGGGGGGGSSSNNTATDEFHFPNDLISIQDRKDEALLVLKSDLMASLNKEVKSLDEDNWMFEGPRSRIQLISTAGFHSSESPLSFKRILNFVGPKRLRFSVLRAIQVDFSISGWRILRIVTWPHQNDLQFLRKQHLVCMDCPEVLHL